MSKFKIGDSVTAKRCSDGRITTGRVTFAYHSGSLDIDLEYFAEVDHVFSDAPSPVVQTGDTVRVAIEGKLGKSTTTGNWYVSHGDGSTHQTPITAEQACGAEIVERYVDPVEKALAALPPSADQIAIVLGRLGIKGTSNSLSCPITEYVKKETGVPVGANASGMWKVGGGRYEAAPHITDFIKAFDSGDYPWLKRAESLFTLPPGLSYSFTVPKAAFGTW